MKRRYYLPMIDLYGLQSINETRPPRCGMDRDAVLVLLAYVAALLALGACVWAHWGM